VAGLGTAPLVWADVTSPAPPTPQAVAQGVWLIPGVTILNREPDGNTVVFDAPKGLIVVDTGRHEWHRRAILTLANERRKPIKVIVNTHWHLDHVTGNPALRAAFPGLRVYSSGAINNALNGFLASSAREGAGYVDDPALPEETRADIRLDLLTIENGAALKPDALITRSHLKTLAGRRLHVNLAHYAATSGDVWLYDDKTRIAVLGDLVTLPAPFLDTACPEGWRAALAQIASVPFSTAIPGHGAPMVRAQFSIYRQAFDSFVACSTSTRLKDECAADWAHDVDPLLADDLRKTDSAKATAAYYVDVLRANGGRSKYCEAPPV
jgi:glyoxylase-like metal-dependent hydrolase (beta-lactamase superfamily II)